MARAARAPTHVAQEEPKAFWWVGACEVASRPGERGIVAVHTLGTDVLRYHVLCIGDTPEHLEPSWRDASMFLIKEREPLPTGMLEESAQLNLDSEVVGAWGYALERAEYREARAEDQGRPRRRVWTVVAIRTEGMRVTRAGIPEEANTGSPYFDADFLSAWMHYERLALINLLSDWRGA